MYLLVEVPELAARVAEEELAFVPGVQVEDGKVDRERMAVLHSYCFLA